MQQTRTPVLSNALTWLELTYSSLKADSLVIFGVITLVIALLCAGAYQEAVWQASLSLSLTPPQEPTVMRIVDLVNQYGLGVLVAICYFSNVTDSGTRREMLVDVVCITAGVLLPQLVFHGTTVWTLQDLIAANNLSVGSAVVSALNLEWLVVWGLSMSLVGLAFWARRIVRRPEARR